MFESLNELISKRINMNYKEKKKPSFNNNTSLIFKWYDEMFFEDMKAFENTSNSNESDNLHIFLFNDSETSSKHLTLTNKFKQYITKDKYYRSLYLQNQDSTADTFIRSIDIDLKDIDFHLTKIQYSLLKYSPSIFQTISSAELIRKDQQSILTQISLTLIESNLQS